MDNSTDENTNLNHTFLAAYNSKNNLDIIKFFQLRGIIHKERKCKCGNLLKIQPRPDVSDLFGWRCTKCRARVALRRGTYLETFKLSLQKIIALIFHWAIQTRQSDQETFSDVSRRTISTFQQKLRYIACKSLEIDNIRLGGIGINNF